MRHPADIIITNAKVFTSDETNPHAEAVAVQRQSHCLCGDNTGAENTWRKNHASLMARETH